MNKKKENNVKVEGMSEKGEEIKMYKLPNIKTVMRM